MSGRRPGGGLLGQGRGCPCEARRLAQRVKPAAAWPGLSPSVRRQAQWAGYQAGVGWVEGLHHQPLAMLLTPALLLWG